MWLEWSEQGGEDNVKEESVSDDGDRVGLLVKTLTLGALESY